MESLATPLGARALRTHRTLMRLSLGTTVFAWLLIFQVFSSAFGFEHALVSVLVLYVFSQALAFLLTPLSAPALRFGVRRALAFGTLCAAFMSTAIALMFAPESPVSFFALLSVFVVFMALQRSLYWVPYQSVAPQIPRTRLPEILLLLAPLLAGFLIGVPGLGVFVFIAAALCALFALIPLIRIPERVEAFEWSVGETIRALFAKRHRNILVSGILDGIQGATLLLLWPITIFTIIRGDWFLFGFLFSLSLLITLIARSSVQKMLKRLGAERSDTILALVALGAWGARLVAPAPLAIVSADVFAGTTISPRRFSVDLHASEQAADGGHFIDEFTALKEMALHLGRIITCLMCITFLFSLSGSFALASIIVLAGIASAVSVIRARRAARAL